MTSKEQRCEICEDDPRKFPVQFFCKTCHGYLCKLCGDRHMRTKLFHEHDVKPVNDFEKMDSTKFVKELVDITEQNCKHHPREFVTYYCDDHDATGCGRCMVKAHRKCHKLTDLREIQENDFVTEQIELYKDKLSKLENVAEAIEKDVIKNRNESFVNKEICKADANKFLKEIIQPLNRLRTRVEKIIEKKHSETSTKLSKVAQICSDTRGKSQAFREAIEQQQNANQCALLYLYIKRTTPDIDVLTKKIHEAKMRNNIKFYEFVKDEGLETSINDLNVFFGHVNEKVDGSEYEDNSTANPDDASSKAIVNIGEYLAEKMEDKVEGRRPEKVSLLSLAPNILKGQTKRKTERFQVRKL